MGLGVKIKNVVKDAGKAVTSPKSAVNMMTSAYSFAKNVEKRHERSQREAGARQKAVYQAAADAEEREFQNDLDHKRRVSKRTNIIFAGLLGDNDEIGLGGQKNLLGL